MRIDQRHAADDVGCFCRLAAIGLEKLQAGGRGEEQVCDIDLGPPRQGGRTWRRDAAALDGDDMRLTTATRARRNGQPADRADRRKCLAAESQKADIDEIVVGEFRCCMALNGEFEVFRPHANAIVTHSDEALATATESHIDLARTGIDGVFDELFHHARRALDDLASLDAIYSAFRQSPDSHGAIIGAANTRR